MADYQIRKSYFFTTLLVRPRVEEASCKHCCFLIIFLSGCAELSCYGILYPLNQVGNENADGVFQPFYSPLLSLLAAQGLHCVLFPAEVPC